MLPILPNYGDSYHPSSHWTAALDTKKKAWQAQTLTPIHRAAVGLWTEVEATYGALHFDHPEITREQIAQWFTAGDAASQTASVAFQAEALALREAWQALQARAETLPSGERDPLTEDDIHHFFRLTTGRKTVPKTEMFRTVAGVPQIETHQPAVAFALPKLLEMALDWFTTDAFAEIHPVEQATLFHLRLLDLQPFAAHNNRLVRLLASFYLLRGGYPPLILLPDDRPVYQETLGYAFQMITQPGVELFARALTRTFDEWQSLSGGKL
ncbi:MAG: Fic family protein [Blastocatellia bacterium]|nr:Fic family protein [Blastocatellia bacterium]